MSPAERLSDFPSDSTIVHELGHVLVGLEIGAQEQGIEFPLVVHDELARAWWGEGHATPWQRLVRSLAGMYIQALLEPQSLDDEFVTNLLEGSLFDVEAPAMLDASMTEHGFHGDWMRAQQGARELNADPATWIKSVRLAHEKMRAMVSARRLDQLVLESKDVVKHWLSTDHEDAPFWPMVLYPPMPLIERWQAWP